MRILVSEQVGKKVILQKIFEDVNLSSFKMQDELCPDIFGAGDRMLPEVRKKLLKIGKDFYEFCAIDWVDLEDIILTGSLANYNWSKFSDVDLHIVIPYKQISQNQDLVEEFTWSKKELWNTEHDIKINDYPVELYAQDSEEELVAGGIYSVLYDKWIKKPERVDISLNQGLISKYVDFFDGKIADLLRKFTMGNLYGLEDDINAIKAQIAALRKKGLNGAGEFSAENIAFKALRRMGFLDKLDLMKSEIYDSEMSVGTSEDDLPKPKKQAVEPEKEGDEDKSIRPGLGKYMILGRRFNSLRQAEKVLGIPKSTIEYRLKSDAPEFSQYRELDLY
jgi:predicted nucleotidyltransferase